MYSLAQAFEIKDNARLPLIEQISHYLIDWSQKNDTLKEDKMALHGDALTLTVAGR